jgi:DNA mismatch repair protein MutS2
LQLYDRSLKALEYDKVVEMLSQECVCADSISRALELKPFEDIESARETMLETEDACRLSLRFGGPSFFGLKNVENALYRAKIGSSLIPRELLDIKQVLYSIRALSHYHETSQSEITCLDDLFDRLAPNKYLEDKIGGAIISEDEIADSASDELSRLRKNIYKKRLLRFAVGVLLCRSRLNVNRECRVLYTTHPQVALHCLLSRWVRSRLTMS